VPPAEAAAPDEPASDAWTPGSRGEARARETPSSPKSAEDFARDVAGATWWQHYSYLGPWDSAPRIEEIEIFATGTARERAILVPGSDVRIIGAHVTAHWWKYDCDVVMVLAPIEIREREDERLIGWDPLLTLHGGLNGQGTDHSVIDIGAETLTAALMFQDHTAGNSLQQTVTAIYLWNSDHGIFACVFDETTLRDHSAWGDATWTDTEIELRDSGREMKDIVITAHVEKWHGHPDWSKPKHEGDNPDYYQTIDEDRTWVFTWDGDRYAGEIDVDED
jgi:hypothetical protein